MSSTKPIIDIIAVAFEKLDELKVFVQSWLNQTEKNWKLTVIHDGPNNKFESIMDSYKKIDSERINFYCTQDRFNDYGHSLREIGLKNVQGEFTLITNADNYFIPKAIEFINQAYFKSECKADVIIYDMIHSHQNPGGRDLPSYSYFKVEYKKNSIDILINNTQGPPAGGPLEKNITDYQSSFDLLFKTHVLTTSLALKGMSLNKWGRIINVASISVKEPLNYLVLSNSIRAALVTWAKSLSMEVAKDNITVNNILTGYFDTDRIQKLNLEKAKKMKINPNEVRKAMEEMVPMKRIGNPEEYGYLVAFLSSNFSSYITGTNIPIDGGLIKSL